MTREMYATKLHQNILRSILHGLNSEKNTVLGNMLLNNHIIFFKEKNQKKTKTNNLDIFDFNIVM